jgi:hypothetical protein
MAENAADAIGDLSLLHIQVNQAIARVAKAALVKVGIAGEKSGPIQLLEKGDDFSIR